MKKNVGKHPKLLPHVLQAIVDLKETRGSTTRNIVTQIQTAVALGNVKPRPRNVVGQVRRALRHGVQTGLLKHRGGKFSLILAPALRSGLKTQSKFKPKIFGRMRKKEMKRKPRANSYTSPGDTVSSVSKTSSSKSKTSTVSSSQSPQSDTETYLRSLSSTPMDRSRRRRRRRKKRNKRRRSRQRSEGQEKNKNDQQPQKKNDDNVSSLGKKIKRFHSSNNRDQCSINAQSNFNKRNSSRSLKREQIDSLNYKVSDDDYQRNGPSDYIN